MITVFFDCPVCKVVKHELQVPARLTEDRDVVKWIEQTMRYCYDEHRRLFPGCRETLKNLLIPIKDAEFIGQQVE